MREREREVSMSSCFVLVVVLVLDRMGWFRGGGRARGWVGWWSPCTASKPWGR